MLRNTDPRAWMEKGVCVLLSLCSSWLSSRGFGSAHAGCETGTTASYASCFSSSLDGGELFSRIQDRGDQAFTERGTEPAGTWVFIFRPFLADYRSLWSSPFPQLLF